MDPLLYGASPLERVVGAAQASDDRMRLFVREGDGVVWRDEPFYPFFHLSDSTLLDGFPRKHWLRELEGGRHYRFLAAFASWPEMWDAVRHVIDRRNARLGTSAGTYQDVPELLLRTDPVSQYLLQSGVTMFKGMAFGDLRRLQVDIETYAAGPGRFGDASRPDDRIILIAVTDNRGFREMIDGRKLAEPEMLLRLFGLVREMDVDVLEGHNIYNFDLPYILRRARLHGIEPDIGRGGLRPRSPDGRQMRTERAQEVLLYDIPGRHIIDTLLLLQTYDHSRRKLESYSLKHAAQHFGFARDGRLILKGDRIPWYWDNEPETLVEYAFDDADETRQLADYLSPPYFHLTQMAPYAYGTAARNGSAAKIEAILLREYVRERESVPAPEPTRPTSGGYADVFRTGVYGPVLDVDVESLYPSIMLSEGIAPHSEGLGVFTRMLRELTALRLKVKREMKVCNDRWEKGKLDAVQSSFKILINSFYGYLGYHRALFNDTIAADRVTTRGQELLRGLIAAISERGGTVLEVDTDGVFFVPPPAVGSSSGEAAFTAEVASTLPRGITLAVNGRYPRMLSYKAKNYALEDEEGNVTLKGSSLTSRSIERFGRRFVRQCATAILRGDIGGLHRTYGEFHGAISGHGLPVEEFARTEALRDDPAEYEAAVKGGRRNRSAPYEAAIAAGLVWRRGERVAYYITGSDPSGQIFSHSRLATEWDPVAPDENVPFYLRRLEELSRKFEVFFEPAEFRRIFSLEDLFGFSPEGIAVVNRAVAPGGEAREEDEEDQSAPEPTILLDGSG